MEELESGISSKSFLYQDNLCVYGVRNDLLMLNLSRMEWTRIEQEKKYFNCWDVKSGRSVYQDHFVILKKSVSCEKNAVCFLNLRIYFFDKSLTFSDTKDIWTKLDIKGKSQKETETASKALTGDLVVYKNSVLSLDCGKDGETVSVGILNLETSGISSKLVEKPYESSLFMSQTGSDITFKIGDQLIPAHKKILIKKSRYFESAFKKDIADVIDIEDCEYEIFKEYLQWIYQGIFHKESKNVDQTLKLYTLADKYLQEDFRNKCFKFLTRLTNRDNVYEILAFAHQGDFLEVKTFCMKFIKDGLSIYNVNELIAFLCPRASEFKELRKLAFSFILKNFFMIVEATKRSQQDINLGRFLVTNIEIDNVSNLAKFVSRYEEFLQKEKQNFDSLKDQYENHLFKETIRGSKASFEEIIVNLREETFRFLRENVKTILTSETVEDSLRDLTFSSLFMSQIESDIAFKIEEGVIHAHKQFLVKRSRYFEKVFNSGMAESRQEMIEITDCEYDVFKEYLRFLYRGTIHLDDSNQIMKLHCLADKYLQEDLCEECVKLLSKNIKKKNFYKILDYAHEKNLSDLKDDCVNFFKIRLNIDNVAEMIEYLGRQEDSELKENNKEFKNLAFNFAFNNFFHIYYDNDHRRVQVYKDFLIKNIEMDTLSRFVDFLDFSYTLPENESSDENREEDFEFSSSLWERRVPETKNLFDQITIQLKVAVFSFIHKNLKTVMTNRISEDFSNGFLRDFTLYLGNQPAKKSKGNGKKRMEPVQDDVNEENLTLKKTKKI